MGYPLRWVPQDPTGWTTVEITLRTAARRLLLRPSRPLRRLVNGVLARGQKRTGVRIHAFNFLSNHGHALISVRANGDLSRFMQYVAGNLAKETGIAVGWTSRVWGRRYRHSILSAEPEIQAARLRYLLENGCKENLVASPLDWPGASSARALAEGKLLIEGDWVDRTALYRAREAGREVTEDDFTTVEVLELTPLPAFEHLTPEQYAAFVRELIGDVEHQTSVRHAADGTRPLGVDAVLAVDPLDTPAPARRTPAPLFLTATREAWQELRAAYREVLAAFLDASGRLRRGTEGVAFPEGTFPPAGPMRGPPAGELYFPAAYTE